MHPDTRVRRPAPARPASSHCCSAPSRPCASIALDVRGPGSVSPAWCTGRTVRSSSPPTTTTAVSSCGPACREAASFPVVVDNDANAGTWAEARAGRYPDQGVAVPRSRHRARQRLSRRRCAHARSTGARGGTGPSRGRPIEQLRCACGRVGCLETLASGQALVRGRARHRPEEPAEAPLAARVGTLKSVDMRSMIDAGLTCVPEVLAAGHGDGQAHRRRHRGLHEPAPVQQVVVSGGLSALGRFLLDERSACVKPSHPAGTSDLLGSPGQLRPGLDRDRCCVPGHRRGRWTPRADHDARRPRRAVHPVIHPHSHPDDESIAAPCTLLALKDAGWREVNFAASLGRPADRPRRRRSSKRRWAWRGSDIGSRWRERASRAGTTLAPPAAR